MARFSILPRIYTRIPRVCSEEVKIPCALSRHSSIINRVSCGTMDTHKNVQFYSLRKQREDLKLLTFDATGTLLAFRKHPVEIYAEVGAKYGVRCDVELMKRSFKTQWKEHNKDQPHFGVCWKAWWTDVVVKTFKGANAQGADNTTLEKVAAELIEYFTTKDCWKLKEGAEDILTALSTSSPNSPAIGIISNFDTRLHRILELFGLNRFVDFSITSYEHQISKPSEKIFELALETYKKTHGKDIRACEAMHVGDNYELDYVGAINAGWKASLIIPDFDVTSVPEDKRVSGLQEHLFPDLKSFEEFLLN